MGTGLLIAALLGGLGGALGGVLGLLLERLVRGDRPRGKVWVLIGAAAGGVLFNQPYLREPLAQLIDPPGPLERFGRELAAKPALRERLRGKSSAEAHALVQQLAASGLVKLDDETLVRRVALMRKLVDRADEETCAAVARGSTAAMEQLLLRVGEAEQREWVLIGGAAVDAALGVDGRQPVPMPAEEQIEAAFGALMNTLSEEERARLAGNAERLDSLPDAELCWTERRTLAMIDESSGEIQATAARVLAISE